MEDGDRVVPLFVHDHRLLGGGRSSPNRLWFLDGGVRALAAALASRGVRLAAERGDPADVVPAFAAAVGARRVFVSRDYTPFGRARDRRVAARLRAAGIEWSVHPGVLIHEPEAVLTSAGQPFRVFGPFRRAWLDRVRREVLPAPAEIMSAGQPAGAGIEEVRSPIVPTADRDQLPVPGEAAARGRLGRWASSPALDRYDQDRDRLDIDGTSRLSADLRFGLLSPAEVAWQCGGPGLGRSRFLDELAWRDFYAHLLWHHPRLARESFRPRLDHVAWERDPLIIEAWRSGRTGYPVVDAAMRQLLATGWMHNRARMIVASFLTKHLGVDWRVGERHFMAHLLDGDPASNNGGWQWAASTGTDPQPWFRVFNPVSQGLRHDPDGAYVRRWVPELAGCPDASVHEPPPGAYTAPIVDHGEARSRALAAYRAAAGSRVR